MERSRFIAKLIGPILIAGGIGMLFNTAVYKAMFEHGLHDHLLIYVTGVIALPVGLTVVIVHNTWRCDWTLIITLFGWLALIGAIVRMVVPQLVERYGSLLIACPNFFTIAGGIALLLGVLLSYFAYLNPPDLSPARGSSRRKR
jgi:hypothetical protein